MSPELNQRVFEKWPQFFPNKDNPYLSGMDMGFRCANGWFQLIWELFEQLEPLVADFQASGQSFEIRQVKSKFGELRVYPSSRNDEIDAAIQAARLRSIKTCENCGSPATLAEDDGWWATLCNECRQSRIDVRPFL